MCYTDYTLHPLLLCDTGSIFNGKVKKCNYVLVEVMTIMNQYLSLLQERKMDEAEEFRKQSIPPKLVKFFPLNDNSELNRVKLQTLEKELLWISSIDALNDPYEFSCMYVDKDRLSEAGYSDGLIEGFETLMGDTLRTLGVASLSGNTFDCLPMWAYYANNYTGYCVEYDVIRADAIHKVSYEPSRVALASVLANFYSEFEKMKEAGENTNPEVEFYATLIMQQLFMKHQSWSHEKEYRIVYPIDKQSGAYVPLSSVGLKTSRIVVGINCTEEHFHALQDISTKLGCGRVDITQVSAMDFSLL